MLEHIQEKPNQTGRQRSAIILWSVCQPGSIEELLHIPDVDKNEFLKKLREIDSIFLGRKPWSLLLSVSQEDYEDLHSPRRKDNLYSMDQNNCWESGEGDSQLNTVL